jgi:hypothetical protein|tara:strand:+ start:1110 stop:1376 length:267 start_codon:yes stop_codon:yes gene_type:complete
MSNEVEKMAEIINYVSCKLMDEGNSPELVAGVLAACSLSIYKSILKDDDYQAMIDEISNSRDSINPFIRTEKASIEDMVMAAHSKYLH